MEILNELITKDNRNIIIKEINKLGDLKNDLGDLKNDIRYLKNDIEEMKKNMMVFYLIQVFIGFILYKFY